jgi:hypothetical protein
MIIKVKTEHELNKALKENKSSDSDEPFHILFLSSWSKESKVLCELIDKNKDKIVDKFYTVDLGEIPHSSSIFNVTTSPTLISIEYFRVNKYERFCEILDKMNQVIGSTV